MVTYELITECLAGNEASIQILVRTYQRAVFQLAVSVIACGVSSQEEVVGQAEVATRETFVAALDRLGRYQSDMKFETWLFGIALQVSRKRGLWWRRRRLVESMFGWATGALISKRRPIGEVDNCTSPDVEFSGVVLERSRRDEMLWQAICGLKEQLRLPVILRYFHDFSIDQIAQMLKISEGAVHARLDLAREKIAARVEVLTNAG